jgi:hypothetical protein
MCLNGLCLSLPAHLAPPFWPVMVLSFNSVIRRALRKAICSLLHPSDSQSEGRVADFGNISLFRLCLCLKQLIWCLHQSATTRNNLLQISHLFHTTYSTCVYTEQLSKWNTLIFFSRDDLRKIIGFMLVICYPGLSPATDWATEGSDFESRKVEEFSILQIVQTGSGAHPASSPMGTEGHFPGVKRPGREAGHSSPASAEATKMWSYISTPPYVFMV